MSNEPKCPNCGNFIKPLQQYCTQCGAKLKMGTYSRVFDKMTDIHPTNIPGVAMQISFPKSGADVNTIKEELFKLGLFEFAEKNYEKAILHWKEFSKKRPDSFEVWSCLGHAYMIVNKFSEAIKCIKKALNINPRNSLDWERLGTAIVLEAQHNHDDDYILEKIMPISIEYFEKAIKYDPERLDLLYKVGVQYASLGKMNKAMEYVQKYLDHVPDDIEVLKILEKMQDQAMITCVECHTQNDIGSSICSNCGADLNVEVFYSKLFGTAFKINKNLKLFEKGMNFIKDRKLKDGIKVFQEILKKEPNHIVVLERLGLTYQMNRQPRDAIDVFEKIFSLNQNKMIALDNLSNLYTQTHDQEKLKVTINRIRDAGSKYSDYLIKVGDDFAKIGDINGAVKYWAKILAFDPEHEDVLTRLDEITKQPSFQTRVEPRVQATIKMLLSNSFTLILKKYNVDINRVKRIRKEQEQIYPGSATGGRLTNKTIIQLYNRAGEKKSERQYSEAISILQEALNIDSSIPILYEQMGINYHLKRETQNAIKYLEKSVELNPYQVLAWETLAMIYHSVGRTSKADEIYNKVISFGPLYANYMVDSGKGAFRNRLIKEAAICWQKALMADPNNIEARTYITMLKDLIPPR